jgi:two-component system response regulator HydG
MPEQLIGGSPALRKIRAAIPRLAADTTPIVIIGEPGVGKSLVASHIHSRSRFKSSELEIINFSLLSERDQRIKLFGGGPPELNTTLRSFLEDPTTLILKHLDQASLYAIQERLTEFLQTLTVVRPGINEKFQLAARVIFTFRSPVSDLSKNKRIHSTLAELLNTYETLRIPPLRSRKEDIPILAERFLHRFYDRLHSIVDGNIEHVQGLTNAGTLDPKLAEFLVKQKWPENVTELKAYIRSLIVPSYEGAIQEREKIEVMKMITMLEDGHEFSLRHSINVIENGIIQRALKKFGGHQVRAAQLLGLTERTIRRKRT